MMSREVSETEFVLESVLERFLVTSTPLKDEEHDAGVDADATGVSVAAADPDGGTLFSASANTTDMLGACDDFLDIGSDLHDDGAFVRRRFISSWRREGVVVVVVDDENESKGCTGGAPCLEAC